MRHVVAVIAILSIACSTSLATASPGQGRRGIQGWGSDSHYQRLYESSAAVMVSGDVIGIEKFVPMKGMYPGVALIMKTKKETLSIHLGPVWYIERLDFKISKGDRLEIKGARVFLNNKPAVMAAEVRKGDCFLILRDNDGIPVWAGWGWKR